LGYAPASAICHLDPSHHQARQTFEPNVMSEEDNQPTVETSEDFDADQG
jgi:hypothetical protein